MRLKVAIALFLLCAFGSCNSQKHYTQQNYSFYDQHFRIEDTSQLRTNGVYLLEKIETDGKAGNISAEKRAFYKFYNSGQVNKILDAGNDLKTGQDYTRAFNALITTSQSSKKATLFESYYRLKGNRMVIQGVVSATGKFYYTYALIEKDQIIMLKSTHAGGGKIEDKYYTGYYKEYYKFIPTTDEYLQPNW